MSEPKLERFYTKMPDGSERDFVMVVPRVCSRCRTPIAEGAYFVYSAHPGTGACWACRDEATDWERFQLERGQAGLNVWLDEQAARRRNHSHTNEDREEAP